MIMETIEYLGDTIVELQRKNDVLTLCFNLLVDKSLEICDTYIDEPVCQEAINELQSGIEGIRKEYNI